MKNIILKTIFFLFAINLSFGQQWMKNLDIAQRLAQVQNKMVLMVWEETTNYQYPVLVKNENGRTIFIQNLFDDEEVSPLIWANFVPVIVSEYQYADLFEKIKGKRSQAYIDKFNDDSIKILDVNGNILNVNYVTDDFQNITDIINRYALNTTYIEKELRDYKNDYNFYSAYFLGSKYLDFGIYANKKTRSEIVKLSRIYTEEAMNLIKGESEEDQPLLKQRCDLLKLQEYLILKRPKKVLRSLKKLADKDVLDNNKPFVAFLYYTAYMSLDKSEDAAAWKSKISSLNLNKAELIIKLNS